MFPAFPTGMHSHSGASPSASQTSNAAVFCPSMRCGLTLFTSVVPPALASSRERASASSKLPRTATTRAPNAIACDSFPSATCPAGSTTAQRRPARAAYAAADAAVFPVEAQSTAVAPSSIAFATATTIPRSLNEPVGFAPSTFSQISSMPVSRSSAGARTSGVSPSPSVKRGVLAVTGRCARYRSMSEMLWGTRGC